MPDKQVFQTILRAGGEAGAWTLIDVPFDAAKAWGRRGRIAVIGVINGFPFRSSIFPQGNGTHMLMVNKTLQKGAGVKRGDRVQVELSLDAAPRVAEPPREFQKALAKNKAARSSFASLSYSHQKEYCDWIGQAKKPETKSRRISEALKRLVAKN